MEEDLKFWQTENLCCLRLAHNGIKRLAFSYSVLYSSLKFRDVKTSVVALVAPSIKPLPSSTRFFLTIFNYLFIDLILDQLVEVWGFSILFLPPSSVPPHDLTLRQKQPFLDRIGT